MIAALYVQPDGVYAGLNGVEVWDEARDARRYEGPYPVVAHPPCSAWCKMAPINAARYGHILGDDGGCFGSALGAVRRWGGVLEHPAQSKAWSAHGLFAPPPAGGWIAADWTGGWTCQVEQGAYGCAARKKTWLYVYGAAIPTLRWGRRSQPTVVVSWCKNRFVGELPRIGKKAAAATSPEFRDLLLSIARAAYPPALAA
jgi:hypothetical protein